MEQQCKNCGRTIVRTDSFKQKLLSRNDSQFCSFSCLILDNPTISKRFILSGVVIIVISLILGVIFSPDLAELQFPPHTYPILVFRALGIGSLWLGSWYLLRYMTYRGIEEYFFHILCKNPLKPVLLAPIVTYASLIDASVDDVHYVIGNLERKRIITRTPQGFVMRLFF